MAVKSSDAITVVFTTRRFDTGAATNGDSLPTGTLYIDGTANAATVTVTNITTGVYKAAVTLPSLSIGNRCELRISATVNSVTDNAVIWRDACDIATDSSGQVTVGNYASGKAPLQPTVAGRTLDVTATGGAGIDWSNVENASSTVTLSATTISTSQQVASVTGDVGGITGVTFPSTVASPTNITAATGVVLAGVTHTGARIPNVTLVDTTTTNTDMRGTDGAALASDWTSTRAGYLDSVLIAANSNRTVLVTGSNHVAAVVHDAEPDSIPEDAFITGALSARVVAADAGAEIATAVRTELATELGRIDATVGSRSTLTATQAADAVLTRGAANVESTAEAYSITDMLLGVFESKVEAGTWTIYRSDGTTIHRTKTITTDAGAEPITRVQ